jgi:DNA-binding NtrC family response regulator
MAARMLLIDDEPSILSAMSEYFTSRGFEVDCAQNMKDAIARLHASQYAVIIADLRLSLGGEEEGLELIAYAHSRYPAARKILLTAHGSLRVKAKALECGVNAILQKPQPLAELSRVVSEVLAERP